MLRVLEEGYGGIAHLPQVEAAQAAGHAYGNALVGGHQHIGEGSGQKGRLLELAVIVVHKIHRVLVDVPEQLTADGVQLGLGVPGGGPGHIAGIDLAEVALGVHKGVEQRAVAP